MVLVSVLLFMVVILVSAFLLKMHGYWLPPRKVESDETLARPKPEDCPKFLDRLFEKRLVEAGVMKASEMTACDNDACPECESTFAERRLAAAALRMQTANERRQHDMLAGRDQISKRERRYNENKSRNFNRNGERFRQMNGMEIPIPAGVPGFADAEIHYDPANFVEQVYWKWTYDGAEEFGMRSNLPVHGDCITAGAITADKITLRSDEPATHKCDVCGQMNAFKRCTPCSIQHQFVKSLEAGNHRTLVVMPIPVERLQYCATTDCSNTSTSKFCQRCRMRGVDKMLGQEKPIKRVNTWYE